MALDKKSNPAKIGVELPGGVIGNTRDFGSLVRGSSPCRVMERISLTL